MKEARKRHRRPNPLHVRRSTALAQRDLTVRSIQVRASSINEQARTVDAIMATQTPARIYDWETEREIDEILIASGATHDGQLPLLDTHSRWSMSDQVGSVRNIRTEDESIIGQMHFASGIAKAEDAWQLVRQRHADAVSIGYLVDDHHRIDIQPGQSREVNGTTYTASPDRPLRISLSWHIKELSLVPIGADPNARIREEAQPPYPRRTTKPRPHRASRKESRTMNQKLRTYLESIGLRADASAAQAWTFFAGLTGDQRSGAEKLVQRSEFALARMESEDEDERADDADDEESEDDDEEREEDEDDEDREDDEEGDDGKKSRASSRRVNRRHARRPRSRSPRDIERAAARAERQRITEIRALAGEHTPAEVIDRCIENGCTVNEAGRIILQAERQSTPAALGAMPAGGSNGVPAAHIRQDVDSETMTASLIMRAGLPMSRIPVSRNLIGDQRTQRQEQLANMGERFESMSIYEICVESLRMAGVPDPYNRNERIRAAMTTRSSTGSFSNIFSGLINAGLMEAYETFPDTSRAFCIETDVNDFKTNERYLVGKGSGLEKIARGEEAPHHSYGDSKESYNIGRYGKQMVFDEQDVIDDNLQVFTETPIEIGQAAAQLVPDLVYYLLGSNPTLNADSTALFHNDHNNTASDALALAAIASGRAAIATQAQDGRNLNLAPTHIIAAQALWATLNQLLHSMEVRTSEALTSGGAQFGTANPLRGLNLQPIVESRIDNGVTDPDSGGTVAASSTAWYMVAAKRNTIEIGFLKGTGRRPQMRSFVLDQGKWGIGWDIKHDVGAMVRDYRALYRGNT